METIRIKEAANEKCGNASGKVTWRTRGVEGVVIKRTVLGKKSQGKNPKGV